MVLQPRLIRGTFPVFHNICLRSLLQTSGVLCQIPSYLEHILWCVSQRSLTITNTRDDQLIKTKGLLCITVSEGPVHALFAPVLLACGEAAHLWQNRTVHLMAREGKGEKGRSWGPIIFINGAAAMTYRAPSRPHLLELPAPSSSSMLGPKPLTHGLLGDTPDQKSIESGLLSANSPMYKSGV